MKTIEGLVQKIKPWLPKSHSARTAWVGALATTVTLLLLARLVPLDGRPHADWEQFLGRFHPLVVHLPIGLLMLVPVLEIAGKFRPGLKQAVGFVLGLALGACALALALGFLLAHGGGEAGPGVTRHLWSATALTIAVLLCVLARPWQSQGHVPFAYPALLTCALLVLFYTAHQGGALTHGSNYLTQYMPASLKRLSTLGAKAPPATSFYARHINPILDAKCAACHGESSVKGGLLMDSFESLMKGGQDGPVIIAGHPEQSLLLQRVMLPPDHKQFMPAEGKPPLKPEEISWIREWIQQGASPTATALAGISIREERETQPIEPVGDYGALMNEIRQLAQGQGAKLVPVSSKPQDGLILYTVDVSSNFGDAQLTQFQKFAPYIVEAELGRTAVTNASFDTLKLFTHLRALHLEETQVTGDGLAKLSSLSQLTYLNLSGTQVTAAALAPLSSMKNLRSVYLYNTPAQPAPLVGQAQPLTRNTP